MARKKISLAGKYAVSLILVLMVFLPLLVTIISSLKIPGSLDAQSPLWISARDMTLNNYLSVFKERYLSGPLPTPSRLLPSAFSSMSWWAQSLPIAWNALSSALRKSSISCFTWP